MKIGRPPICETANLLVWLALLVLERTDSLVVGLASFYLPMSLALLLIRQLTLLRSAFDLSILFLVSCLFFFCIGLILWPISSFSPTEFSSLVIVTFTWEQLDSAAIWIGLSIAITMATMMTLKSGGGQRWAFVSSEQLGLVKNRYVGLYRVGVFCIFVALPAVTLESIDQLRFIQDAGYLALYTDGVPVSATSKAFFYIFDLGFGLTLAFSRTRSQFLTPAILFLLVATIDSLKGARGALLVPLLFVAWFYVARFNIRVRPLAVLRNIAIIVIAFAAMTFQRNADLLDSGMLKFAVDALTTQGRSLQTTALYQTVADEVSQYGNYTVLSNLLTPFTVVIHPEVRDAAQSMDQVLYSNNLKHILTYVLNKDYYFAGGGTGGVYTIELLESGPVFYVLLSMGLGWFLVWMPVAMRKPWVRYLSVYFFSTVFYLPRGELFFNTLIVGKALFLYLVVVGLHDIYKHPKRAKLTYLEKPLTGAEVCT
jgi:O-antigen polysaccharide polymerase Wzy